MVGEVGEVDGEAMEESEDNPNRCIFCPIEFIWY